MGALTSILFFSLFLRFVCLVFFTASYHHSNVRMEQVGIGLIANSKNEALYC